MIHKFKNNQSGFSAVEVLLALIFLAIVVFIGVYIAHNRSNSKNSTVSTPNVSVAAPIATNTAPKLHTSSEATAFVQKTYNDYLTAINNADDNNTQPLGLVGLTAVKDSLAADFYTKAAASPNGADFSCAAQFLPSKYTASSESSDKSSATVALVIGNSNDGTQTTSGMKATVDLATLKITAVTCPN